MVRLEEILSKEFFKIAEVQINNEMKLFSLPNVVGVSLGHKIKDGQEREDQMTISVLVENKIEDKKYLEANGILVPPKLDEIETDVVEIGEIFAGNGCDCRPLPDADQEMEEVNTMAVTPTGLTRRMRPCPGGFSVGHRRITAGTLGTCCYDLIPFPGKPKRFYILSNNHVLANSNNAKIGDPILQPGPADGGTYPRDLIGRLSRFVTIKYISGNNYPDNYVDAAIAEANLQDIDRSVYWLGTVKKIYAAPRVGDILQKAGRTTGITTGKVTNINATVRVNYGYGRVAKFVRQIITTDMSAGGDSGSLVTNLDEGAVGLLFAGSPTRTIINNIRYVQTLLNIRVTEK